MIMKKDIKRKKRELFTDTDMKRYIGALSEKFTKQVGGVAEQWLGVKKDTSEIKEILNTHTEMIGKLMTDMTIIKEDMEFLKGGLKRKVDYDEFLALERRTAILESNTKITV